MDFSIGKERIAFLTGFTYSDFGDIKIGKNRSFTNGENNFGLTNHYVGKTVTGLDTMLINNNPETQLNTGYKQYDLFQKIFIEPNNKINFNLNFQYSTSTNVPRYDQLTEYSDNIFKYSEWYYGPQTRFLGSASAFFKNNNNIFTNLKATFAYQKIKEDRISRKFGAENKLHQNEDVDVYSLNFDFFKFIEINRLHYGLEITHNNVSSSAYYQNIFDLSKSIADTRYPDGGSIMQTASAYVNYKWIIQDQYILTGGFRYSYTHLYSEFLNRPSLVQLPYSEVNINNAAPTGILSFEAYPSEKWKLRSVLSTGFRSPNVDDYGKIRAKSGLVTVPNNKLKPEYIYNAEIGVQYLFKEDVQINISGYYNYLTNAIVRTDYQLNGQDSMMYDGDTYKIITNSNASEAIVSGLSVNFLAGFNLSNDEYYSKLKFKASFNYTYGIDLTEDEPLSHIPPMFGLISLNYETEKLNIGVNTVYQSWKYTHEMALLGEDNNDKGTSEGFPEWYTINFNANYRVTKNFMVKFAVENIFDEMYRSFASGVSAPGRNFIFSLNFNLK